MRWDPTASKISDVNSARVKLMLQSAESAHSNAFMSRMVPWLEYVKYMNLDVVRISREFKSDWWNVQNSNHWKEKKKSMKK